MGEGTYGVDVWEEKLTSLVVKLDVGFVGGAGREDSQTPPELTGVQSPFVSPGKGRLEMGFVKITCTRLGCNFQPPSSFCPFFVLC